MSVHIDANCVNEQVSNLAIEEVKVSEKLILQYLTSRMYSCIALLEGLMFNLVITNNLLNMTACLNSSH